MSIESRVVKAFLGLKLTSATEKLQSVAFARSGSKIGCVVDVNFEEAAAAGLSPKTTSNMAERTVVILIILIFPIF
jgi:hypothetical protein